MRRYLTTGDFMALLVPATAGTCLAVDHQLEGDGMVVLVDTGPPFRQVPIAPPTTP